jgi:hypothetical protein
MFLFIDVWEEHSTLKRDAPLKWQYSPTKLHDIATQPLNNADKTSGMYEV